MKNVNSIAIIGEITAETLDDFMYGKNGDGGFLKYNQSGTRLEITLSSPGGDIDVGMSIYEMLRCAAAEVAITGYGIVGSIAVLIFMGAAERRLSAGTRVFLHPGSAMSEIPESIFTIRAKSKELLVLHDWYVQQIVDRVYATGADATAIDELCGKDTFLSADEALKKGIATEVVLYR